MSIGPVDIEFVIKGDVEGKLKRVSNTVKGESGAMKGQMDELQRSTLRADAQFGKMKNTVANLIPLASLTAVGLAMKQIVTETYRFSNEFSKAMREVQTLSKAVQADFNGISQEIINMSAQSPDGAIALAEAYYQIVSAGRDGAEGLELLKIASQAAVAGITDTTTAADGITTVLNAWGKETAEAEKVADVLFKTVEKGKTTFPELARNIATVAPLAASMNVSLEEVTAATATLTAQGVPTAQAMTQIRSSLVNLNKALGDGWSDVYTYQEALAAVAEKAGGSQTELRKLIPDIEGMNAVLALTGDKASDAADDLEEMGKATGSMRTAYGTMLNEADNQWSMVHNKWKREMKGLGDSIKETSTIWARFLNAMMTNSSDAMDVLGGDIDGFIDRWAAMQALREETLGGWTDSWYGKAAGALTGLDLDEWRALFADEEQVRKWLENSKAVREERKKQEESFKRTDTASIITQIADIDAKLQKEQQLLSFYESRGTNDPELELIRGRITAYQNEKMVWENLLAAKKPGTTQVTGGTEENEVVSTFQAMQTELKELQKAILDADEQQQRKIAERIIELQQELALRVRIADEVLRATRNATYGSDVVPERATPISAAIDDDYSALKKVVKETTLEHDKLNRKIKEGEEAAAKMMDEWTDEGLDKFLQTTYEISMLLQDMSYELRELNPELSEMIDQLGMFVNIGTNIASGNYVAAASGILQTIVGWYKQTVTSAQELKEAERATREESLKLNDTYRERIRLLESLGFISPFEAAINDIDVLNQKLDVNKEKLNDYQQNFLLNGKASQVKIKEIFDAVYGEDWGANELSDAISDWDVLFEKYLEIVGGTAYNSHPLSAFNWILDKEKFNEDLNSIFDAANEIENVIKETERKIINTTAEELANSLSEAFLVGIDAAEDWGRAVDEIIKHVITRQLTASLIAGPVQEAIDKLIADTEGGLTTEEAALFKETIEGLAESVGPAFEEARQALESIGINMGTEGATAQGMTGAIRALTEETGGMIYGQLMGIRYDIKAIIENIVNDEDVVQRNLAYMAEIAENTRHNRKLVDIDTKLGEMNILLRNI